MTNLAEAQICNSRDSTLCSVQIQEKGILDSVQLELQLTEKLLTDGRETLLLMLERQFT